MHMNASIFHVVWFIRKECGRGNFSNLIKKKERRAVKAKNKIKKKKDSDREITMKSEKKKKEKEKKVIIAKSGAHCTRKIHFIPRDRCSPTNLQWKINSVNWEGGYPRAIFFFFFIFLFFHFTLSLFFPPSSLFFFCFQFSPLCRSRYRSVPVHGNPSSRKYTRGMQDWLGNGLDMFIDILKCRSPVFGCIVSYREGREQEKERERGHVTPQQSITL